MLRSLDLSFRSLKLTNLLDKDVMDIGADLLEPSTYKSPERRRYLLRYRDCPEASRFEAIIRRL